jgi:hypothetical protein
MIIRDVNFAVFIEDSGYAICIQNEKIKFDISHTEFSKLRRQYEKSGIKRHAEKVKSLLTSLSQDKRQNQLSD